MKDYEALSKKHFDAQAADYDAKATVLYSREGKISCRDIAALLQDKSYDSLLDVGNIGVKDKESGEYKYVIHCHEGSEAGKKLDAAKIPWQVIED